MHELKKNMNKLTLQYDLKERVKQPKRLMQNSIQCIDLCHN